MALAADRNTQMRRGVSRNFPMAAAVLAYAGALMCVDASGDAKPGVAARGLRGIGRASRQVDNSAGIAGALTVEVENGIYAYANSGGADAITQADIGRPCYIVDDQTVARTDNSGARSIAGMIYDVDAVGVWVDFHDSVGSKKPYITLPVADLVGGDGKIYGIASPCAGKITNIRGTLEGHVITTGNAVLTGKIGGVAITGGVVTFLLAGTAVGNEYDAQPTAANAVNPGDRINFTVSGTQDNAVAFTNLVIEITT